MARSAGLPVIFFTLATALSALGQQPLPQAADSGPATRIAIQCDPQTLVTQITIRAEGGRVSWGDVLRGLARARGYDDAALEGVWPARSFDPAGAAFQATRLALNLALGPGLRLEVEPPEPPGNEPRLTIRLDRAALVASQRRFKARLRDAWLRRRPSRKPHGLVLDEDWQQAPADRDLVVVVHGFLSDPEHCRTLLQQLRKEGLPCGTFHYPNDQTIAESAKALSAELKRLAREHPTRRVALVTHSLGGLVARAVVEDAESDPGNVRRLVMVAPPNHGSSLAPFGFALDVWEHVHEDVRKRELRVFYEWVEDGMAEAAADLVPGSPALQKLNARPRNPQVRYTIFLGTGGPLQEADLSYLRRRFARAGEANRWVRFFGPRVDAWLADLDEVVEGKGDGVVAVKRGRLEGVDDTAVLRFRHNGVLGRAEGEGIEALRREILKRLRETG